MFVLDLGIFLGGNLVDAVGKNRQPHYYSDDKADPPYQGKANPTQDNGRGQMWIGIRPPMTTPGQDGSL